MRSPTYALLWEIWWPHRAVVAAIAGLTIAGRLLHSHQLLIELLGMLSFLLLFGIFNAGFPRRHFTLPISSLRLVAVPMLTGVVSIELLHLLWIGPPSRGGSTSAPFVAVLLGAF